MDDRRTALDTARQLLRAQRLGVLATAGSCGAHGSLITFAAADDLASLLFTTRRDTRKFANLERGAPVAILVDNRPANGSTGADTVAATLCGEPEVLEGPAQERYRAVFLDRHPDLTSFVDDAQVALVRVAVTELSVSSSIRHAVRVRLGRDAAPGE